MTQNNALKSNTCFRKVPNMGSQLRPRIIKNRWLFSGYSHPAHFLRHQHLEHAKRHPQVSMRGVLYPKMLPKCSNYTIQTIKQHASELQQTHDKQIWDNQPRRWWANKSAQSNKRQPTNPHNGTNASQQIRTKQQARPHKKDSIPTVTIQTTIINIYLLWHLLSQAVNT